MTSLEEAIEEYRGVVENSIFEAEEAKRKLDLLIELKRIKNRRVKGEQLTTDDVHRAMTVLCWGNLAGCCSPAKECSFHLAVCDALGLDPEEIWSAKKDTIELRWGSVAQQGRASAS